MKKNPYMYTLGERLIELDGNTIILKRYVLVDYHKRDYDYEQYKSVTFESEEDAKTMFNLISDSEFYGHQKGTKKIKEKSEELLKKVMRDIRDE